MNVLEEANSIIYGDREKDYGTVTDNFTCIAIGWEQILKVNDSPEQVGLCMAWLKIARECNGHKKDNIVDLAGYAGTIGKYYDEQEALTNTRTDQG